MAKSCTGRCVLTGAKFVLTTAGTVTGSVASLAWPSATTTALAQPVGKGVSQLRSNTRRDSSWLPDLSFTCSARAIPL